MGLQQIWGPAFEQHQLFGQKPPDSVPSVLGHRDRIALFSEEERMYGRARVQRPGLGS